MAIKKLIYFTSIVITICISSFAHASDNWRDIQIGENSLLYSDKDLSIRGVWKAAGSYKFPRIAKINAAYIYCDRNAKTCVESQAQVEQLRNSVLDSSPYMTAYTIDYEILEWSKEAIVAKRINPRGLYINSTLKINSVTGVVEVEWKDRPNSDGYFLPSEQQFEMSIKNRYGA